MADLPDYHAFGLHIRSDIALPFAPVAAVTSPDVRVALGAIPDRAAEDGLTLRHWRATPDEMLLHVAGVGRILVTNGTVIRVELAPHADVHDLVSHVQGSAFAALLQQRGLLTLHASCVETASGAVLAIGSSGAGKSTLLGAMLQRGFRMIADDVTPIAVDPHGVPLAVHAYPNARLWRDSLETLEVAHRELRPIRPAMEKYYLPVPAFRAAPQPIHAILVLQAYNGASIRIESMPPADRAGALVRNTYRKLFLTGMNRRNVQFDAVAALSKHAAVLKVFRPQAPLDPLGLAQAIIEHLDLEPVRAPTDSAAA